MHGWCVFGIRFHKLDCFNRQSILAYKCMCIPLTTGRMTYRLHMNDIHRMIISEWNVNLFLLSWEFVILWYFLSYIANNFTNCRSVIEVRNGYTFLDLIVLQIEVGDCDYSVILSFFFQYFFSFLSYAFLDITWNSNCKYCSFSIRRMDAVFPCYWWTHLIRMRILQRWLYGPLYSGCIKHMYD